MNPTGQPYGYTPQDRMPDPKEQLKTPAILLLVLGALGALSNLLSVLSPTDLTQAMERLQELPPESRELATRFAGLAGSMGRLLALVGLALSAVMAYGAWQMKEAKSYSLALASAIIGLLPVGSCCCCLSLPVGIWAITILVKPEVKAGFTG